MKNATDSEAARSPRRYLSVAEVAAEYGGSVGFWRKAIHQRQVPYFKLGRLVRLSRQDLDVYLASRRVEPARTVLRESNGTEARN